MRISKADTAHRDELNFLRGLVSILRETRSVDQVLSSLDGHILYLEHGTLAPREATRHHSVADQPVNDAVAPYIGNPWSAARHTTASPCPSSSPAPGTCPPEPQNEPRPIEASPSETPLSSESDDGKEHATKIRTIEFLAWGRHVGRCFPHRSCQCRSVRPYSEMASINADPAWAGICKIHVEFPLFVHLKPEEAKRLVMFHFDHILWHHNVFHAPTFLAQCEEFWTAGTVDHPLWMALYLSVLAVSFA